MRTAWICVQCRAGSVGEFAHVLRAEHEQWTAHRTEDLDPRFTQAMLGDICIRKDLLAPLLERRGRDSRVTDFPSLGEGVPQLVIAPDRALGGEQPGEGDLPRSGEWFLTVSGRQAYPLDMRPGDFSIQEIAHSLSMLCRFNGHCQQFYSVAQHSLLVAEVLPPELKLQGLLHDGTEAYCGDMIRPIKRAMPAYRVLEDGVWRAIAAQFGLPEELHPAVKKADTRLLQTERRDLLAPHRWKWMEDQIADDTLLPYEFTIQPMGPREACSAFLWAFRLYSGVS